MILLLTATYKHNEIEAQRSQVTYLVQNFPNDKARQVLLVPILPTTLVLMLYSIRMYQKFSKSLYYCHFRTNSYVCLVNICATQDTLALRR